MEDVILMCAECGIEFTFPASEQEFFARMGFSNVPRRCVDCRRARKLPDLAAAQQFAKFVAYPLRCRDCEEQFEFRIETQKYFARRGYPPPTRCVECQQKQAAARRLKEAGRTRPAPLQPRY